MTMLDHDGPFCSEDPSACSACATEELLRSFTSAVRAVAHGNVDGPGGLEALAMAVAGSGSYGSDNLTVAVHGLASELGQGLREIAGGLHAVAKVVEGGHR